MKFSGFEQKLGYACIDGVGRLDPVQVLPCQRRKAFRLRFRSKWLRTASTEANLPGTGGSSTGWGGMNELNWVMFQKVVEELPCIVFCEI